MDHGNNNEAKSLSSNLANKGVYEGDLNNISGDSNVLIVQRASNSCANSPEPTFGIVETMYIDQKLYGIQRFTSLTLRTYIRKKSNDTWESWAEK